MAQTLGHFHRKLHILQSFKVQIIIFLTSISSLSALMLHFSKQFLIVMLVTSFHTSCSHQIATITSTPLKTFVADASSWMLASIFLTSLFQYLTLKFWMIPASSGCSLEVVFVGKKLIFICKKLTNHRLWMTRSIAEKNNDLSALKYELSVEKYQYSFHYFRCHSRCRIRKIVNIRWV